MAVKTLAFSTWSGGESGGDGREHINDIRLTDDGQFLMAENVSGAETPEAYSQIVIAVVRTLRGEILLDTTLGIDYQRTVWVQSRRVSEWKRLVLERLARLSFIRNVDNFEATVTENGKLVYSMTVTTDFGVLTATDEVSA